VLVAALNNVGGTVSSVGIANTNIGTVENLGKVLFSTQGFLLPFEVSSVLFLAAMIGAVFISKREIH
jgi:NADH-quinone oxidoreductase subunit J